MFESIKTLIYNFKTSRSMGLFRAVKWFSKRILYFFLKKKYKMRLSSQTNINAVIHKKTEGGLGNGNFMEYRFFLKKSVFHKISVS
jgi:predicted Mrr-cat superfamily restriction endonuclease